MYIQKEMFFREPFLKTLIEKIRRVVLILGFKSAEDDRAY